MVNSTALALRDFFPDHVAVSEPANGPGGRDRADLVTGIREVSGAFGVHVIRFTAVTGMFEDALGDTKRPRVAAEVLALIEQESGARTAALQPRWCKPSAAFYGATLVAKIADDAVTSMWLVLEFEDHDGPLAGRASEMIAGLAMIVQSHMALQDRLTLARAHEHAALAALDRDDCGTIAVKADTSVLFANAAAQAILADEAALHVRRGILRPTRYHDAVRFQVALDSVLGSAEQPGGRRRGAIMMLAHPSYQRPLIVVLVPAPASGDGDAESPHEASAIVYLIRPDRLGARGLEQLCQLYGLTPVETRLVGQLLAGHCVSTAASQMGVKPDTARAYLKQVFAKTGTHRQSELLHLMAHSLRGVPGDIELEAI